MGYFQTKKLCLIAKLVDQSIVINRHCHGIVSTIPKPVRHFPPLTTVNGISARKLVDFISVAGIGIANGVEKFFVVGSYHFMSSNVNRKVRTYKKMIFSFHAQISIFLTLTVFPAIFECRLRQHFG